MPKTVAEKKKELIHSAMCDLLPVRDFLDDVMVRDDGSFVAGVRINGAMTYFATDDDRNQLKFFLESLLLVIPEESMRLQFRYEVDQNVSDTINQYEEARTSTESRVCLLDKGRVDVWREQNGRGEYLARVAAVYFIWDPLKHGRIMAETGGAAFTRKAAKVNNEEKKKKSFIDSIKSIFSGVSVEANVSVTYQEHRERIGQFEAILNAAVSSLKRSGLGPERMTHCELFLEIKRALDPLHPDTKQYQDYPLSERVISAAEQLAHVSIIGVKETFLNVNGMLYAAVTMKLPPDATAPGVIRDLLTLGIPMSISTQIIVPNQRKVLDKYKRRYKKMQAALNDGKGGQRADMNAAVAAEELLAIQKKIIASSVKTVRTSLTVVVRTSKPAFTEADYAEAEQLISERAQRVVHVIGGLNGARGYVENIALERIFLNTLPGFAGEDRRDHDLLTEHAADLVPVEMPWPGTKDDPAMMLRTPYRQLVPFSHFSPSLENANMILCATSGTGKGMLAGKMLLTYARQNAKISILERGDSYAAAVEYMGGQMITMSLDSPYVINPFDLDDGDDAPSNDHLSFLKNLIRYMLGDNSRGDSDILDSVILLSIKSAYRRASNRINRIPTLSDVRDELVHFNDKGKNQRVNEEASLAAAKLQPWVEDGMYASLFDRQTTVDMNSQWLYFNVEKLKDDPKLETAMSLLIAYATTKRAIGTGRQKSLTVLDECWSLLESKSLGPVVVQLFRTARKRNACVWGISQAVADFTGTPDKPNEFGEAILTTTATKFIGRQKGNLDVLRQFVHVNDTTINYIKSLGMTEKGHKSQFVGVIGEKAETTFSFEVVPTGLEYWIMTTFPREKDYRAYWLVKHSHLPLEERYILLAEIYPNGISMLKKLPEEESGEVWDLKRLLADVAA